MAVQLVATTASQLINTSTNISLPIQLPAALAVANNNAVSVNVWINANWGTTAAQRGRRSFVGIYGPATRTQGLTGYYYNDKLLTEPYTFVRADSNVNLNLSGVSPAPGINPNAFSMRWSGYLNPPTTSAYYYFRTNSDDGIRVYINNILVIDNWTDHSATINTSTVAVPLTAGTEVPIVVEYYNQGGETVCILQYGIGNFIGSGSATFAQIPNANLATSAPPSQSMSAVQIGTAAGAGEITCWVYGGGLLVTTPADFAPQLNNTWINVCYTWNGVNHILYVNGVLAASSVAAHIPGNLKYITINGYYGGAANETDNHYVDSYMLYDRALSADEVLTIYSASGGRHGIWNGLVAGYEFDEGANGTNATIAYDLTVGGANLLMTGAGTAPKYTYTNSQADSNNRPPVSN